MVRRAVVVAVALFATACSQARPEAPAPSAPATAREPDFATDEQKTEACVQLRDHAIVLFADQWADSQGVAVTTPEEHEVLYTGFAQAMEEKGTLRRFAAHCSLVLTPRKYHCGMASRTPDTLAQCMRTSALPGRTSVH